MAKVVSRYYLNEKWEKAKWDMEHCLDVEFKNTDENIIPEADIERCYRGICDNLRSIIKELEGCKYVCVVENLLLQERSSVCKHR